MVAEILQPDPRKLFVVGGQLSRLVTVARWRFVAIYCDCMLFVGCLWFASGWLFVVACVFAAGYLLISDCLLSPVGYSLVVVAARCLVVG